MIHQVTFTKRKMRDMLKYKMRLKSDKLIDLKVKLHILSLLLISENI